MIQAKHIVRGLFFGSAVLAMVTRDQTVALANPVNCVEQFIRKHSIRRRELRTTRPLRAIKWTPHFGGTGDAIILNPHRSRIFRTRPTRVLRPACSRPAIGRQVLDIHPTMVAAPTPTRTLVQLFPVPPTH